MADQNFPDNLDVLRDMNSGTVDLIVTDPPFNKKRNYSKTAGFYCWDRYLPDWVRTAKGQLQKLGADRMRETVEQRLEQFQQMTS